MHYIIGRSTDLYAGQRATVTGSSIVIRQTAARDKPDLVLDDVVIENFVLERGQFVELLFPQLASSKKDTYSMNLSTHVNGRLVKISVSTIMEGTEFVDQNDRLLAVITNYLKPNSKRGYLLFTLKYNPEWD